MSRTAVIHQPDFLPYLGFFHRLLKADVFILLDHVQFVTKTSKSWTHRDKVKTPKGGQWVTLQTVKAPLGTPINEILLADSDWRIKNLNLFRENYRKAPFFDEIFPRLEELYAYPGNSMSEFNERSIFMLNDLLGIKIESIRSSALDPQGKSNALLVDLLGKVQVARYLSGTGAKAYYEPEPFDEAGIEVLWQEFEHPVYPQLHGEFIPYLSSVDLLFNCGAEASCRIIRT
ncbi:MAG: WbqC family protein [Nitrospina sp.]|nr:WbqC family protein [Nitrospina sp.]